MATVGKGRKLKLFGVLVMAGGVPFPFTGTGEVKAAYGQ
jgi:hypothetical protein